MGAATVNADIWVAPSRRGCLNSPRAHRSSASVHGIQAVMVPDQDALYTVRGTETQKWLALPDADRVLPGAPRTFMVGDSILYGG